MKRKMKVPRTLNRLFFSLLFLTMNYTVNAQHTFDRDKNSEGDYNFTTEEIYLGTDSIFINYKDEFDLGDDDEMVLSFYQKSGPQDSLFPDDNDTLRESLRYKQYYKGYEVEDAVYTVQAVQEMVQTIHGKVVPGLSISTSDPVTEDNALQVALDSINATVYAWENSDYENYLKDLKDDTNATYFPQGELLMARKRGTDLEDGDYAFVWRFNIFCIDPFKDVTVDIDCNTGLIFNMFDPKQSCNQQPPSPNAGYCGQGTVQTLYNGTRNFNTRSCSLCINWWLRDCRGSNGHPGIRAYDQFSEICDDDNTWTSVSERPITTAHWIGQECWDFFKSNYGRDGIDNNKAVLSLGANFPVYNALYHSSDNSIRIGISPTTGSSLAAVDIIGHEYTHGVQRYTSALIYEKEQGALNESFSDIFGMMIERYAYETDWTLGEDAWLQRDMSDPPAYNQPAIYHGTNWYNTTSCTPTLNNDYCGVHINSGVQNKWFYLLANGGTFNTVTVNGIGIDKAAKIAYYNVTVYLGPNSNYLAARANSLSVASVLYGQCSNERRQVANAWAAVGIGSKAPDNVICLYVDHFPITLCQADFLCYNSGETGVAYTVHASSTGATYTWNIPSGWTATISGGSAIVTHFDDMQPKVISVTATLGSQTATYSHTVGWNPHCELYGWPCDLNRLDQNKPSELTSNSDLNIYPNPAKNTLESKFEENDIGSVLEIQNGLGQTVFKFIVNSTEQSFDISGLTNGIYFVILKSNSYLKTGKLFVKK